MRDSGLDFFARKDVALGLVLVAVFVFLALVALVLEYTLVSAAFWAVAAFFASGVSWLQKTEFSPVLEKKDWWFASLGEYASLFPSGWEIRSRKDALEARGKTCALVVAEETEGLEEALERAQALKEELKRDFPRAEAVILRRDWSSWKQRLKRRIFRSNEISRKKRTLVKRGCLVGDPVSVADFVVRFTALDQRRKEN